MKKFKDWSAYQRFLLILAAVFAVVCYKKSEQDGELHWFSFMWIFWCYTSWLQWEVNELKKKLNE